jgi:hypothetical protein
MIGIEIGERSPEQFEAGKEERILEEDLNPGELYYWMSLQSNGEASIYPSTVHFVGEHEPSGLTAVRFAILSGALQQIRLSYSLFADGMYMGQRNGLPFIRHTPEGGVTVEEGYFQGPIETELEEITFGVHGHTPAAQRKLAAV